MAELNSRLMAAALEVFRTQGYNGTTLERVAQQSKTSLDQLKATGQLRPVSDLILARTIVSLIMGFVLSDKAMPEVARMALRLFPQRAWLDGASDLLLFGILEDDAR